MGDTGSVQPGLPLSDRAVWLLVSHDSPKGREYGGHLLPLPSVCHPLGWHLSKYNTNPPCRRGNDLSVFQLNLQTHILIQRKMPVWYHRSNTILQGAACSPRWVFTSCHDRGLNPRPPDWGAGTIPLCHSDLHKCNKM